MGRLVPFTRHEAALLLSGYLRIKLQGILCADIVKQVSDDLRKMAINRGVTIDERHLNINRIHFQMESMAHFIEVNFVTDYGAAKIFGGSQNIDTLITNLSAYTHKPMEPGKTSVLFDEVQECPEVRTAIKFLVEDARFDYIESGLLLGVRHKEVRSFLVGFEEIYRMFPMDLEECLWANGVQRSTVDYLRKCFESRTPVS